MTPQKAVDLNMRQLVLPAPVIGEVRIYTFEVNGELILFDTGLFGHESIQFLRSEIDLKKLKYVFITHWHPEHAGLAAFLGAETSAEIFISKRDADKLSQLEGFRGKMKNIFLSRGFPDVAAQQQSSFYLGLIDMAPVPDTYRILEESHDLLDHLGIRWFYCPWHSARDVVYLLQNYAVIGDTVLKDVFSCPTIEVDPTTSTGGRFNNYRAFCDSISLLKQIEDYTLLPSHREPVASIDAWVEFIVSKLVERTRAVASHLRAGKTVYQTVVQHFQERVDSPFFLYLKASEIAMSHDFLLAPELLLQALEKNNLHMYPNGLPTPWLDIEKKD